MQIREKLRRRLVAPLVLALAAVASALSLGVWTSAGHGAGGHAVVVADGAVAPPGVYVAADVASARGKTKLPPGRYRLAARAAAPLIGGDGPVATPSADGQSIAYNTWTWAKGFDWKRSLASQGIAKGDELGVPTLRVHDLTGGRDDVVERGALSAAWRSDGALAYARGTTPAYREGEPYTADVVVRAAGARGRSVVWSTKPGRYLVYGWAGETLIAVVAHEDGGRDVVAFDGPGSGRTLATDAGVLGISPDGTSVLLGQSADTDPVLRVVAAADGRELASLRLDSVSDAVTGETLRWVGGPGSWVGDHVVLTSSTGLVVLKTGPHDLEVDQVLHLDLSALTTGTLYEPRFVDSTANTIVTWADVLGDESAPESVQFSCDRAAMTCTRGVPVSSTEAVRPVYDVSGGKR